MRSSEIGTKSCTNVVNAQKKTDQAVATLKRARYELQDSLRVKNDRIETLGLETGQLQRELQLTRKGNHASKKNEFESSRST